MRLVFIVPLWLVSLLVFSQRVTVEHIRDVKLENSTYRYVNYGDSTVVTHYGSNRSDFASITYHYHDGYVIRQHGKLLLNKGGLHGNVTFKWKKDISDWETRAMPMEFKLPSILNDFEYHLNKNQFNIRNLGLDGPLDIYNNQNKLVAHFNYKSGYLHGLCIEYDTIDFSILYKENYYQGVQHGYQYYHNDSTEIEKFYKLGKLMFTITNDLTSKRKQVKYKEEVLINYDSNEIVDTRMYSNYDFRYENYHDDGRIKTVGFYNSLDYEDSCGHWRWYDTSGALVKSKYFWISMAMVEDVVPEENEGFEIFDMSERLILLDQRKVLEEVKFRSRVKGTVIVSLSYNSVGTVLAANVLRGSEKLEKYFEEIEDALLKSRVHPTSRRGQKLAGVAEIRVTVR